MAKPFFTTSVRLKSSQIEWLILEIAKILKIQNKHIDRSAVLRGLIDGLASARVDLSACSTEGEIKRLIAQRIGANGKTTGK